MHTDVLHLREVVVFLAATVLIAPLMHRLRISPVIGFLVAGLIIGPFGLGRFVTDYPWLAIAVIEDVKNVQALAELGILFLLFTIGLELTLERLVAMRRLVFGLGGAQVVITALVIGWIAQSFGNSQNASIIIGAALALSSTAVVMQLLVENRRLGAPVGKVGFSVLLFQDLAVVPILFLVGVLGAQSDGSILVGLGLAFGKAAIVIVAIIALGRIVVRPIFHIVGATKSREVFMAALLLVSIGTAVVTDMAGLSLALGAFLAGLLLAETEYRHQIEVDIEPFKGLLLGLFFVSVGMSLDLSVVLSKTLPLVMSVIGLFAIKSAILFGLARLFGVGTTVSFETAILLGQSGEFAFVVISQALAQSLVPPDIAQFMLLTTIISMFMTPAAARLARSGAAMMEARRWASEFRVPLMDHTSLTDHVVVAGYGRVGQMLGGLLEEQKISHVGIDIDVPTVSGFRRAGAAVYFGDASRGDILQRVGLERARALAVTMDNSLAAERVVETVRANFPDLPILASARDHNHAQRLIALGATDVVPETVEASLDLSEIVFQSIGFTDEAAHRIVDERRELVRESFMRLSEKKTDT